MVSDSTMNEIPQPIVGRLRGYSDVIRVSQELAEQSQPFLRSLELAFRAGARYYLQWYDRQNPEWMAEHKLLYSHVHPPQPDYLIRLDFFSSNPLRESNSKGKYIGYVSLRPGPIRTVAECAIQPPIDTKNHYLLCKSTWETSYQVSEVEYVQTKVHETCPFVQQDAVAGICAHACIRTISLLLGYNFEGCNAMTVESIQERVATMPLLEGSHLPSTGLTEFEIVTVVEAMGAAPDLYLFEEGRERRRHLTLEQVIYPYIESGIPVMVGIETEEESHGIVVIGHTFDQDSWWQQAEIGYFPTLAGGTTWIPSYMWVPEFIIQDDNFGPYLSASRTLLGLTTRSIIVPTPKSCHVFLPGYQAESLAANYLASSELYQYILQRTQVSNLWRKLIEKIQRQGGMVLRPILISKEALADHVCGVRLSQQLSEIYQQADLSPWVWLVEVSVPEIYSQRQKIGEIIINPSYPAQLIQTGIEPVLALRIFDVVVTGTNFAEPRITTDCQPVSVLMRPTFEK